MATIVTRAGKGVPLTTAEVDANFTNLDTDKLEAGDALGTPASVTLTNATGLPTAGLVDNAVTNAKLRDSAGLSVMGRGANSTGDPADIVAGTNKQVLRRDGSSLAFGAVDLSSNQAVTGTLPVNQGGTGITSFGSGVAAFLGTPSSANLAAAVTNETGTGALVFANSPTLVTPALGTPASGVVTNLTGTASININGTVGAATPAAGAFTTLSASSTLTGLNGVFTGAVVGINDVSVTNTGVGANDAARMFVDMGSATGSNQDAYFLARAGGTLWSAGIDNSDSDAWKLDLGATPGSGTKLRVDTNGIAVTGTLSVSSATSFAAGTAALPAITRTGDTNTGLFFPAADTIAASTAGTERLRITSAGKVGIGTSTPRTTLNVHGVVESGSGASSSSGSVMLRSRRSDTNFNFINTWGCLFSSSASYMGYGVKPSTSTANGFVGGVNSTQGVSSVITNDGFVSFQTGANQVITEDGAITITERLRITSAGNVGIGTTTPSLLLQIAARGGFDSDGTVYWGQDLTGNNRGILSWDTGLASIRSQSALTFLTNGNNERLRITSAGNVGINETAPDYKLDVNGTFGFTPGASVTPADNGDVVFELTNNTTLTVKAKGSDGVVRSGTITLA